ncbi:Putative large ribosomal subunit protein bL31m [Colletotrichum destructivum]|uniref:Large ribosomal subunit protein bL31m n=1 Tax=Colletotrichum destructivum TaxID=34406 RepID=A0AAX4J2E7_9PEZI|nr:Putative large ribosomal subunit protein bL31m [Colletotrichum destructivum]
MSKLPTHLPRPSSLLCCRPRIAATSIASSSSSSSSPLAYNASTPIQRTSLTQTRAATFVPRPRRPYTFTQLVQLSDGSTFTVRSTSPAPLVRSVKDSRNHALWQPSDKSLKNVEVDEAGKLAAFRERFGRGFDLAAAPTEDEAAAVKASTAAAPAAAAATTGGKDGAVEQDKTAAPAKPDEEDDAFDMGDLISGYAVQQPQPKAKEPLQKAAKKGKK